jgi:hypothetical protein
MRYGGLLALGLLAGVVVWSSKDVSKQARALADRLAINGPAKAAAFGSATLTRDQVFQRLEASSFSQLQQMTKKLMEAQIAPDLVSQFSAYASARAPNAGT